LCFLRKKIVNIITNKNTIAMAIEIDSMLIFVVRTVVIVVPVVSDAFHKSTTALYP